MSEIMRELKKSIRKRGIGTMTRHRIQRQICLDKKLTRKKNLLILKIFRSSVLQDIIKII